MGEPTSTTPPPPGAGPQRRGATYVPDPEARAALAFADGPAPPAEPGPGPGHPVSRRTTLLAAFAVVVVVIGAFVVVGRLGRPATDANAERLAAVDQGPFDTPEAFVHALPVPDTFTRLPADDAATAADVSYVVDGDFEAACAGLGGALRAMDPSYPELVAQDYVGGGVNRCEATGPMAPLHGATVRALVLKVSTGAQLYIEDLARAPAPP